MSSASAPGGIGSRKPGPLLDAVRDNSPETRLAVLDALTRLPLEPSGRVAGREIGPVSVTATTVREEAKLTERPPLVFLGACGSEPA